MQYVEAKIPLFFFQEGSKVIAYSPAFDISTYGSNEEEAKRRFGEVVTIFLKECTQMGTLEEVLEECGWQKSIETPLKWSHSSHGSYQEESVKIPMPA
jgi:hypothetical protein